MSDYILRKQKEHLGSILSLTGVESFEISDLPPIAQENVKNAIEAISQEPDLKMWIDREFGIPCLLLRNPDTGNWCGYVKMPLNSTYIYNESIKSWDSIESWDLIQSWGLEVHGEVTYVGSINTDVLPKVRPPEFSEGGLWVGFDCAHWKDLIPSKIILGDRVWDEDVYRTIEYAFNECTNLARQVALLSSCYN